MADEAPCPPWLSPGVPNPECAARKLRDAVEEAKRKVEAELARRAQLKAIILLAVGYYLWRRYGQA